MKIKLNIQYIQNLTNNEAFTYFCTLVTIANNPDATIKDVVRTCGIGETTVFKHLKKFDELGYLDIDRTGTYNTYSYTEPDRLYITIDSDLLNINGNKNQLGALIRLKSYTRIGTNIVDLSLNRIVRTTAYTLPLKTRYWKEMIKRHTLPSFIQHSRTSGRQIQSLETPVHYFLKFVYLPVFIVKKFYYLCISKLEEAATIINASIVAKF